jgi:hypothetical protein
MHLKESKLLLANPAVGQQLKRLMKMMKSLSSERRR